MIALPVARSRKAVQREGFTLLELLVSMTILTLIVVLVSRMMASATSTINHSSNSLVGDSQARDFLDRIERDLKTMLLRPDINYSTFKNALDQGTSPATTQSGTAGPNDWFACYAESSGYFTGATQPAMAAVGPYALIGYDVFENDPYYPGPVVQRLTKGLSWDDANPWHNVLFKNDDSIDLGTDFAALFANFPQFNHLDRDLDFKTVGDQIFRFEYVYLLKGFTETDSTGTVITAGPILSTYPYDRRRPSNSTGAPADHIKGMRDVAAIVVAIGVLDGKNRSQVTSYDDLIGAFPDAVEGVDIESRWLPVLNNTSFASNAGIPQSVAANVRVYQRYIYLR